MQRDFLTIMKHEGLLIVLGVLVILSGCPQPPKQANTAASQPSLIGSPGTVKSGSDLVEVKPGVAPDPRTQALMLRFEILTIETPVGVVSGSEDVWSYLDEEAIGPGRVAALGRNGFRVGRGQRATWPDLARVLRRMTSKNYSKRAKHCLPGRTVIVPLGTHRTAVTIFTSHADRTLSGADYPPGADLLSVQATLADDEPWNVLLTGMPQIQAARQKLEIVKRGGRVVVEHKSVTYEFDQLRFQLTVRSGDFLVIGPGAEAQKPSSVGHHFLVREVDGVKFETVVVMIPKVFAVAKAGTTTQPAGPTASAKSNSTDAKP